jgi:hypothetical protein
MHTWLAEIKTLTRALARAPATAQAQARGRNGTRFLLNLGKVTRVGITKVGAPQMVYVPSHVKS